MAKKKKKDGYQRRYWCSRNQNLIGYRIIFHSKATAMGSIAGWLPAKANNRQSRAFEGSSVDGQHMGSCDKHL